MTKLNKQFEKARQVRLDEKSAEYDGKDNPKNYKNMDITTIVNFKINKEQIANEILNNKE
jgi:hypothetical protein